MQGVRGVLKVERVSRLEFKDEKSVVLCFGFLLICYLGREWEGIGRGVVRVSVGLKGPQGVLELTDLYLIPYID